MSRIVQIGLLLIFILHIVSRGKSQEIEVFSIFPSEKIKVEASSEFEKCIAEETVNGSGMQKHFHKSDGLGKSMWMSDISTEKVKARMNTREGAAWIYYEFDKVRKLDLLEIWNYNQNNHTRRGLRKVYLQYSTDGISWYSLKNGDEDLFIIPESSGKKEEPVDFSLPLNGLELKYFCITADLNEGNYYHDKKDETLQWAKEAMQNINYYGLSEIRFYEKVETKISELEPIKDVSFNAFPGYRKTKEGPGREFKITFDKPLFAGGEIELSVNGRKVTEQIAPSSLGIYEYHSLFPVGYMEEASQVHFSFSSRQGKISKDINVEGARKWTLYFLPHSHLDIGYTHEHGDLMDLQVNNIKKAIDLIEQTKNYPEGSGYKWNVEAMWPMYEFMKRYNGKPELQKFKEFVRNGDIGLNASVGSILTGICKQEELTHMFDDALRLEKDLGIDISSVMMSDIPGLSWGTVTSMCQNGLKYFSSAPNYVPFLPTGGSRVGYVHREWGDKPFFWKSQSGDEKILFWSTGRGYSFFHDWLAGSLAASGLEPIWQYLQELEEKEFPYDISYLRYTIRGDNGPPDTQMPDIIREWNKLYEYPKFCIGTSDEVFSGFEKKYQEQIPVYSGDFTPYWEEGAASTAAELAMNRSNAEKLNQLEILWSMIGRKYFPSEEFYEAWRNIVLFSEHTWGASQSYSQPESEFTKTLWKQKRAFAINADSLKTDLKKNAANLLAANEESMYLHVFNTSAWSRTDVVRFSSSEDIRSMVFTDENGIVVDLQETADGKWIFVATDVPPLSSKVYQIIKPETQQIRSESPFRVEKNTISNGKISVTIDKNNGAISSLLVKGEEINFATDKGLNEYIYSGQNATSLKYVGSVDRIEKINDGSVAVTLQVTSGAPGCNSLVREYTIYKGLNRLDIKNTLDKKKEYSPENVRFCFPFNIPNSEPVIDLAFEEIRPEREQLPGSNKNFYSVNNGVTVIGQKNAVLLTTIDAPILEIGKMTGEQWRKDQKEFLAWKMSAESSPVIYSWVMNNSWRTNYKASQEGLAIFHYSVIPLKPYSHLSKQKSTEIAHPLIAMFSGKGEAFESLFRFAGKNKISVSTIRPTDDKNGYLVRLVNLSNQSVHSSFEWGQISAEAIYECDNNEKIIRKLDNQSFWLKPFGTLTLKLNLKN